MTPFEDAATRWQHPDDPPLSIRLREALAYEQLPRAFDALRTAIEHEQDLAAALVRSNRIGGFLLALQTIQIQAGLRLETLLEAAHVGA